MSQETPRQSFADYSRTKANARFSDWLRDSAEPDWTCMVGHRFTHDIATDALPPDVLRRYLIYEHGFVETAITIFGYALVKAPTIVEQTKLVETLRALTTDQLDYFDRVFERLGISVERRPSTVSPPSVLAFRDGMLSLAAHGTYEEIIAGMTAAEWMYLNWSRAASRRNPSQPVCAEWIALHVNPQFIGQVAWLREQLDSVGPLLPPFRQQQVAAAFHRTLVLEIGFHDAPYAEESDE